MYRIQGKDTRGNVDMGSFKEKSKEKIQIQNNFLHRGHISIKYIANLFLPFVSLPTQHNCNGTHFYKLGDASVSWLEEEKNRENP